MPLIRSQLVGGILLLLPHNILAQSKQVFDVEIEDIFALIRYMIGLGFVVFGTFFLLYKDCAKREFLKRYQDAQILTGEVVACTLNKTNYTSPRYEVHVIFTAHPSDQTDYVKHSDPESYGGAIMSQDFLHSFISYWMAPEGSKINLYCIPDQPQSAITKDFLEEQLASFSWVAFVTILIPALGIAVLFVTLCMETIDEFPNDKHWVGWTLFGICNLAVFVLSWGACDEMFCDYAAETFLSSQPVYRKVLTTRPPSTIILTPPASPRSQAQPTGERGEPSSLPPDLDLGIEQCRSQSSLTTENDLV
jgi:hypothetical protein